MLKVYTFAPVLLRCHFKLNNWVKHLATVYKINQFIRIQISYRICGILLKYSVLSNYQFIKLKWLSFISVVQRVRHVTSFISGNDVTYNNIKDWLMNERLLTCARTEHKVMVVTLSSARQALHTGNIRFGSHGYVTQAEVARGDRSCSEGCVGSVTQSSRHSSCFTFEIEHVLKQTFSSERRKACRTQLHTSSKDQNKRTAYNRDPR